jgi:hypothetical protein
VNIANLRRLRAIALSALGFGVVAGCVQASAQAAQTTDNKPPSTQAATSSKPNVVFILADNVGYGDMGRMAAASCAGIRRLEPSRLPARGCASRSSSSKLHAVRRAPRS